MSGHCFQGHILRSYDNLGFQRHEHAAIDTHREEQQSAAVHWQPGVKRHRQREVGGGADVNLTHLRASEKFGPYPVLSTLPGPHRAASTAIPTPIVHRIIPQHFLMYARLVTSNPRGESRPGASPPTGASPKPPLPGAARCPRGWWGARAPTPTPESCCSVAAGAAGSRDTPLRSRACTLGGPTRMSGRQSQGQEPTGAAMKPAKRRLGRHSLQPTLQPRVCQSSGLARISMRACVHALERGGGGGSPGGRPCCRARPAARGGT